MVVNAEQAISIVRGMSSVEVMEPESALFQVETSLKSGRPPKWTLNGEVLEPCAAVNISREGTLHSLCLAYTESSMSGPVVFVAGKSRSTAQLIVKGVYFSVYDPKTKGCFFLKGSQCFSWSHAHTYFCEVGCSKVE